MDSSDDNSIPLLNDVVNTEQLPLDQDMVPRLEPDAVVDVSAIHQELAAKLQQHLEPMISEVIDSAIHNSSEKLLQSLKDILNNDINKRLNDLIQQTLDDSQAGDS